MKTAAIYCRVSTQGQAKDGTSLDTQEEACITFATNRDLQVVAVVRDDMSGAQLARPGLDRIRDLAERGEVQTVVVYDTDRLSRNVGHLMLLVEEFERNRVELAFVNAPHENTPEGMMLLQMRGMFAQYERTKIQERSRRGKERRAREGQVFTSWAAPYGYNFVEGEGRFEIVPVEAQIVTRIFDWYITERASLRGIAHRLNEMQVPTKRGAPCWHPSTIRAILQNSVYGGTWFYNKTESAVAKRKRFANGPQTRRQKSAQHKRPREEWIGVPVPAIISPDVYPAVRAQMERNTRHAKRNCKTDYLLRGLMTCAQCGRRLTGRRQPHPPRYWTIQYYCTGRYEEGLRDTCKCPWPSAPKLDARAWEKIVELMSDEEFLERILVSHEQTYSQERSRVDADLAALKSSEEILKAQERRHMDAYGRGIIDIDQLQEIMADLRKQRGALQSMRAELEEQIRTRNVRPLSARL